MPSLGIVSAPQLGIVSGPYLGTVLVPELGVVSALVRTNFRALVWNSNKAFVR